MSSLTPLTDDAFAAATAEGITFVDFYADWCGPCQMMLPVVSELADEYAGKVAFYKMNVDENGETPMHFGVRGIPYFVVLKDGELLGSITGALPKAALKARIDEIVAGA